MEERYWLRHPSLHGHQGPYSKQELRASLDAKAFPADSYVLLDEGLKEDQRRGSIKWQPAATLLGLLPALDASTPPPPKPKTESDRRQEIAQRQVQRQTRLRYESAYLGLHSMISVLFWVAVIAIILVTLLSAGLPEAATGTIFVRAVVEIIGLYVVAGLARALLDIADCALRRQHDLDEGVPAQRGSQT